MLGAGSTGSSGALLAGLEHAVRQGSDVVKLSLSTTKSRFESLLRELADEAYFRRTMLVASAHNLPSVLSVASHEEPDPLVFYANPEPPVELYARGVDIDAAWLGGGSVRVTGNSFATPHVSGLCALVLGKRSSAPGPRRSSCSTSRRTSWCSRRCPVRAPTGSSVGESRPARVSPAGCSPRGSRSCWKTYSRIRASRARQQSRRAMFLRVSWRYRSSTTSGHSACWRYWTDRGGAAGNYDFATVAYSP